MKQLTKSTFDKLVVIGLLAAVTIAATANCLAGISRYQQKVNSITYSHVDIAQLPDGSYSGTCDVGYISASVEVLILDGRLADIQLTEHKHDRGEAAEAVIGSMLQQQSLPVDAVSGATNSSRVIQKAVDNALVSAQNEQ